MARGRIIYPAFWHDSKIVKLSPFARLFYIGMWNHAYCGKGHLDDDADELKLKILPVDQVDADELLAELMNSGRVQRLELPGVGTYLWVPKFAEHQQKDDPRHETRCPVCRHEQTPQNTNKFPQGGERKGRGLEGVGDAPSPYCDKHPKGTDDPCRACGRSRIARADWDKTQKNKPTPGPPRKEDLCPIHEWNLKASCNEPH